MLPLVRIHIQLDDEQYEALEALAREKDVPLSELIRQGVDLLIAASQGATSAERRKRAIALAGRFHSQDLAANVSAEHDEHLAEIFI